MIKSNKISSILILPLLLLFASQTAHSKLILLYTFDGNANDKVSSKNGTIINNPIFIEGKFGQAIQFDAKDDYVSIPAVKLNSKAVTLAFWFNMFKVPRQHFSLFSTNGFTEDCFHILLNSNTGMGIKSKTNQAFAVLECEFYRNALDTESAEGGLRFQQNPPMGQWNHLTVTFSNSELTIYINSKLITSTNFETTEDNSQIILPEQIRRISPALIGAWNSTTVGDKPHIERYFDGAIDDFALFDHALNQQEINQLYLMPAESFIVKQRTGNLLEKLRKITQLQPDKAITFTKEIIQNLEQQGNKKPNDYRLPYKDLSLDPYFQLAKAEEAVKAPKKEIIESYTKVISKPPFQSNFVPAFVWLFKNTSNTDYLDAAKDAIRNCDVKCLPLYLSLNFEANGNWPAFQAFLDNILVKLENPKPYAEAIAKGLQKDGTWLSKFLEYCRSNPKLTNFIIERDEAKATEHIYKNEFVKAAEIYSNIAKICLLESQKVQYELKEYTCIIQDGQYEKGIQNLKNFIEKYKDKYKTLTQKTVLLLGRVNEQTGDTAKAIETFNMILSKNPEDAELTAAAHFYLGNCYISKGEMTKGKKMLNEVIQKFPKSSYAVKADLKLNMIKTHNQ